MPEQQPPVPPENPGPHPEAHAVQVPWNPIALRREVQAYSDDTLSQTHNAKNHLKRAFLGTLGIGMGAMTRGVIEVVDNYGEPLQGQEEALETVIAAGNTVSTIVMAMGALMTTVFYLRTRVDIAQAWRIRDEAIERELRGQSPPDKTD